VRIRRLAALLLLAVPFGADAGASGESDRASPSAAERERLDAVGAGLDYLWRSQNRDGSFGETESVVGVTALCMLAFFAAGHQEGRGRYGKYDLELGRGDVIRRGIAYLLAQSRSPSEKNPLVSTFPPYPPGYIVAENDADSRMHGHCYAAQALLLAYGSGKQSDAWSSELRRKVQLALQVIENAQTMTGGWGYDPTPDASHEGSITVCAVQALRLATDAGFVVDKEVQRMGLRYLHDSQRPNGSFKYALMHERTSVALTAAAVTALHGFGEYYSESVRLGLEYLRNNYRRPDDVQPWYYYGNFYSAQAFYRAGGKDWERWCDAIVPSIVERQERGAGPEAGSWDDRSNTDGPRSHGRVYATAMSCLALSVPDGFLPLFQK